MEKLFSTSRTAQILDVSTQTLKRWYKWYNSEEFKKPTGLKLPEPVINSKGTMFFTFSQVQDLQGFHEKLQNEYRGCMADFNAVYQWGNRGTKILKNKEKKKNE